MAETCAVPPGVTSVKLMPTVPSGLKTPMPTALPFFVAPHWSSDPSSVKLPVTLVSVNVTRLR